MGRYFEEFYRYDLPRHYLDSRQRHHLYDHTGRHRDDCLAADVQARLEEINEVQHIDTTGIHALVVKGVAYLRGHVTNKRALHYVATAVDCLEGIMRVELDVEVPSYH